MKLWNMVLGCSVWGSRFRVKGVHLDDGTAEGDIVADGAVVRTLLAGVAEEGHGGGGGKGAGIGVGPAEGAAVSEEGVLLLDTEPWVLVLGLYTATGFGVWGSEMAQAAGVSAWFEFQNLERTSKILGRP
jgi:hypothetical protein